MSLQPAPTGSTLLTGLLGAWGRLTTADDDCWKEEEEEGAPAGKAGPGGFPPGGAAENDVIPSLVGG